LKPVAANKVALFDKFVPLACPIAQSIILDAEVLMIDTTTDQLLPFGTLGVHKRKAFASAQPILVIFDILSLNGTDLLPMPIDQRRALLEKHVVPIKHRIQLSELRRIMPKPVGEGESRAEGKVRMEAELKALMTRCVHMGLEGLVLKDVKGKYAPGSRHWLKMKKDYLNDGAMADSADLVVVGAFYGHGSKGGTLSTFLMACYDADKKRWNTVCKVGNGHDDSTLAKINKQLLSSGKMKKISKNFALVPDWLNIGSAAMTPDYVVVDPKSSPIWEIQGAEYAPTTASSHHTACASIRFPRVSRVRSDKDFDAHTTESQLKALVDASAICVNNKRVAAGGSRKAILAGSTVVAEKQKQEQEPPAKRQKGVPAQKPSTTATANDAFDADTESDDEDDNTESENKASGNAVTIAMTPPKPKLKPLKKKPLCRYGAKCYRKCPQHKLDFRHPRKALLSVYVDDEEDDAMDTSNIVGGGRKRKRVDYTEQDSNDDFEIVEDDDEWNCTEVK
jgi:DNA ligase-3